MNPPTNTTSSFPNSSVDRESGSVSSVADTQISAEENCQLKIFFCNKYSFKLK